MCVWVCVCLCVCARLVEDAERELFVDLTKSEIPIRLKSIKTVIDMSWRIRIKLNSRYHPLESVVSLKDAKPDFQIPVNPLPLLKPFIQMTLFTTHLDELFGQSKSQPV